MLAMLTSFHFPFLPWGSTSRCSPCAPDELGGGGIKPALTAPCPEPRVPAGSWGSRCLLLVQPCCSGQGEQRGEGREEGSGEMEL